MIKHFEISYFVIYRGVTHGDELIYLFSPGVFDLTFLDWEIARVISNLWANFVIYGYFHIDTTYRIYFTFLLPKGSDISRVPDQTSRPRLGTYRRECGKVPLKNKKTTINKDVTL